MLRSGEAASRSTPDAAPLLAVVVAANLCATAAPGAIGVSTAFLTRELGVPLDHANWIPDAFLVAVVCVTPLAAFLARRFDPRRLLAAAVLGLAATAALAALAPTLPLIVAAVFLHGLFAAPVAPVTQSLVATRLPEASRGRGMAWWTGGLLGGGLLGGTLGGPIAQEWNPHLAILVVLPLCALAAALLARFGQTVGRQAPPAREPTDFLGATLLILGTLGLGAVLNLGDNVEWFDHPSSWLLCAIAVAGWVGFALHYRRTPRPIIDLAPLRDARFAGALLLAFGLDLVSTGQFEGEMLGTLLGFDAEFLSLRAGLAGLGLLLGVALAGTLCRRLPETAALLLALALLLAGKAGYLLYGGTVGWVEGLWPGILSSVGYGMLASLLAAYAFDRLDASLMAAAAACFVFAGQLGAAFGLAGLDGLDGLLAAPDATPDAAGDSEAMRERSAFITVFVVELVGGFLLLVLLPAFRRRKPA